MPGRLLMIVAAMAALAFTISTTAAQAPKLGYEFFKSRVEPIFLAKRPGYARCYGKPFTQCARMDRRAIAP